MLSRATIQSEALSWLGVKWRHQGRSRNGVDCVGLVVMVAEAIGYAPQDVKGYSRRPSGFDFLGEFRNQMDEIPKASAQPGDVLVFKDTYYPCHCSIMVEMHDSLYMVHAHAIHRKVIIDNISSWEQKWCNSFKFRGVD